MKIYLAGSCSSEDRTLMKNVADYLREALNFEVYCPFELKIPNAWDLSPEEWAHLVFNADIEAINNCDMFVMISVGRESTAGTNWEQGYAYALGKEVYVFQITDKPTSLMTFCGCTRFCNCLTHGDLKKKMHEVLVSNHELARVNIWPCHTLLT